MKPVIIRKGGSTDEPATEIIKIIYAEYRTNDNEPAQDGNEYRKIGGVSGAEDGQVSMAGTGMNQYRCENGCKHFEQHYCNFLHDRLANIEIVHIERVGCASHSDFQSERDCPICGGKLMCHRWCIDRDCEWDSMKELRRVGEP